VSFKERKKMLTTGNKVAFVELLKKGKVLVRVPVDEKGNYRIPNLLPGSYTVRAYNGYIYSEPKTISVSEGQAVNLSFAFSILPENEVYAYPNPTKKGEITFHLVTSATNNEVKIKIYNIAGELVRVIEDKEINKSNFPVLEYLWNCKNEKGNNVASGVYIYQVKLKDKSTGKEEKVTKKLAIIR